MKKIFANPVGIQIDQLKTVLSQNPVCFLIKSKDVILPHLIKQHHTLNGILEKGTLEKISPPAEAPVPFHNDLLKGLKIYSSVIDLMLLHILIKSPILRQNPGISHNIPPVLHLRLFPDFLLDCRIFAQHLLPVFPGQIAAPGKFCGG